MVYDILFGTSTFDSLENYIKNMISIYKNAIFKTIVTPSEANQNVHVLNSWMFRMSNELGLDFTFKSDLGTFDQDIYDESEGGVLCAFFCRFTIEFMIEKIKEDFNSNKILLGKYTVYILENISNDYSYIEDCFNFDSEQDKKNFNASSIKENTIKAILLKMDIISENSQIE
jgi:hypothetical protein